MICLLAMGMVIEITVALSCFRWRPVLKVVCNLLLSGLSPFPFIGNRVSPCVCIGGWMMSLRALGNDTL